MPTPNTPPRDASGTGLRNVVSLNDESRRNIAFALRKIADEVETDADQNLSAVVVLYAPNVPLRVYQNGIDLAVPTTLGVLDAAKFMLLRWQENHDEP